MGSRIDPLDEGPGCLWKIVEAWRELSSEHRPKRAASLLRMIIDIYQYPYPDFIRLDPASRSRIGSIDQAINDLIQASSALTAVLPKSEHWHVLPYLMERRLGAGNDHALEILERLPNWTAQLALLHGRLKPAEGRSRGAPTKRPSMRLWVGVIWWYVLNVEQASIKLGFDDAGNSQSRITVLVRATLSAMGFEPTPRDLETELKRAKRLRLMGSNFWDLIPVAPPGR